MFVLEVWQQTRLRKIQVWEEARDKWLKTMNADSSYVHYTERDYERKHPRPGITIEVDTEAIWMVFVIIIIALAVLAGVLWIVDASKQHHNDTHKAQAAAQKKPDAIKVGDTVQVVYGAYKDSVGVVVKDDGSGAVIKLTNSTLTKEMCLAISNCTDGDGTDNGGLLGVDSLDNLVPYKAVK